MKKPLLIAIVLSLLFTLGAAHAVSAASPASPRRTDAHQLLRLAEAGLGDVVHAAEGTQGRLDRAKPEQRPFWRAVDNMNAVLRRVRAGMMARNDSFFSALQDGSVALGELRVVWARTGVPDPGVNEGLRILSESYQLLRTGYGREAVRHRKGRGLTEAERERFLRIQQAQRQFADLLRELQEIARKRNDAATLAELQRMAREAERIANAQLTLNAYLNALMLGDAQRGEWTGNLQYATPDEEWQEAGTVVEDLYTRQEIGHVYALDLGTLPDIAPSVTHFEEPTELPDSLAADAAELDPIEEQEAFYEEEMEEVADTDLEMIEEIVVVEEEEETVEEETEEDTEEEAIEEEGEEVQEEIVLEEGEEGPVEEKTEEKAEAETGEKTEEKAEAKPAEAVDPKKEPAPAPAKKDSKKKSARPPS